jgi:thiol:disulfide interchange protein DsbA
MEHRMKNSSLVAISILLLSLVGFAQAAAPAPVAGKDYIVIPDGQPLQPADGKVVVEEFFNYICPACNHFEPMFVDWQKNLPDYVKVVHVPASFRPDFEEYARAFYAAKVLGLVGKTHEAVFKAIHTDHILPAEGDKPDEQKIADFYARYGVSADKFLATMDSFAVDLKVRQATEHLKRSGVMSTPTIVVNGRYRVKGKTYADILRITSYLIQKEHGN